MHIPTCQTQDLEILTFQQALVPTNEDYDRTKWLYVPDYYADYRYLLGTGGESPHLHWHQPLHRRPGDLDNTLKSVERIAAGNGYDSFLMFNVYAQRATRPEDMDQVCNAALHRENMAAFRYVLEQVGAGYAPAVWAAWGPSSRNAPTSGTASGTWWPSGRRAGPSGCAPAGAPRRAIPTTPSTCGKRRKCGPLPWCPTWTACEDRTSRKKQSIAPAWRTTGGAMLFMSGVAGQFSLPGRTGRCTPGTGR